MAKVDNWQHVIPQSWDETHEAPVRPVDPNARVRLCRACGKQVYPVPSNEGPEGLKALLRL